MASPAFIVEGKHERTIVQRLCFSKFPIRILGSNGEDVSPFTIAQKLDIILDSLNDRNFPIIVVLDREKRTISAEELEKKVKSHLSEMGHNIKQMIFGIPDRKIEAWILPFVDESGNISQEPTSEFEGKDCLGELEKRLRKKNITYKKTTVGTKLFCSINPVRLAEVSMSFRKFYEQAGEYCSWLKDIE